VTIALAEREPFSIQSFLKSHLFLILTLIYVGLVFDSLLFYTQGVNERDGFFHARYSAMLTEQGLSRHFPWMQFTMWKDGFCDKDFLYHVFLAPFCLASPDTLSGAKIGTLALALMTLLALYVILRMNRVPWPVFWVLLLAFGSGQFLSRLLMVRSHVLSIGLMIVAFHVLSKERFWPAFILAFIYAWAYSFPLAMLITAAGMTLGRYIVEPRWRVPMALLATALGILAGLLIHPYSPQTFSTLWLLLTIAASGASGGPVELGSEFLPITLSNLIQGSPGMSAAIVFALVAAGLLRAGKISGRRLAPESAAVLCAAALWLAAMFFRSRLVEYFAPAAVFAAGLVWRDWLAVPAAVDAEKAATAQPISEGRRGWNLAALLAGTLAIAGLHSLSVMGMRGQALLSRRYYASDEAWKRGRYFDGAALWMQKNLKPGATVINFHWDDFPELYYSAPSQNYIVGLDPTLLRLAYPEHSRVLEEMRKEKTPLDFKKLGTLFQSQYVVLRRYRAATYPALKNRSMQPVYEDEGAVIYSTGLPAIGEPR